MVVSRNILVEHVILVILNKINIMNEIDLKEFVEIFKYVFDNNKRLIDAGKNPVCISAEGPCGIGKTTAVQDLAKELKCTFIKINLSELEEVSD